MQLFGKQGKGLMTIETGLFSFSGLVRSMRSVHTLLHFKRGNDVTMFADIR